ncbi:UDP-Glycosyltransferase/glycogen phosphorylase [Dendrothele bispora CBS 962.96]|uniref:UDP-Glycosyltransferase/glycogen phosphorylase n=1 Tax=Dendrothele bispora (strain CBS 962.96) TaxID=1314807 RepID=A0A4V4HHA2_DENBC|nr:UDP-Glycosyltransferase/glycogen phosphorylase [Dendrothele bispora CBS 962.96]
MFKNTTGEVVHVPGCPPMYDYEWHPQATALNSTPLFTFAHIHTRSTEGAFVVSSSAYEEGAIKGWRTWFRAMGKPVYEVGPLSLPDTNWKDSRPSEKDLMVIDFMDRMQQRFGEKSLIYVSFGTVFFPADPSKVWILFDELIANQVPFIFAHTSELANVPDDKKKLIAESGIGMEMKWAPQEIILKHPATGWFISHGGWNSVQEALVHRTPMIYWPMSADQPYNAALVSLQHKAGFELLEVRTSAEGLPGQPYRCKDDLALEFTIESARREIRALLENVKGEEGRVVRKNCEELSEKMGKTWDKDGGSKRDLGEFLSRFIDGTS